MVLIPVKMPITMFLCLMYHAVLPIVDILRYACLIQNVRLPPLQLYTESIKTFRSMSYSYRDHLGIVFLLLDIALVVFLVIAKHVRL